jgi:hypothetical protein
MWKFQINCLDQSVHTGVLNSVNELTEFYKNLNASKFVNMNRANCPESLSLNTDLIVSVLVVPYNNIEQPSKLKNLYDPDKPVEMVDTNIYPKSS